MEWEHEYLEQNRNLDVKFQPIDEVNNSPTRPEQQQQQQWNSVFEGKVACLNENNNPRLEHASEKEVKEASVQVLVERKFSV